MTLSIDVVIPTLDRWDLTERCLEHLSCQTAPHTVVVADNGSRDGTPDRVRASFPQVRVIELGANLGFSAACNRGVASAFGDAIVLLNNDVEVRPDFLEKLVEPLFDRAEVATVAALLVQPGGQTIDSIGVTSDLTLAGFPRLRGRPVAEAKATVPILVGPSGGAGAYRRTAWEQAGGLDEGVRFYGEDLDLALRIRSAHWETIAAPAAIAVHLGSATMGQRSQRQRHEGGFARGYFARRYRILSTSAWARTIVTEAIVVAGDAASAGDLSALRGRAAGWRAARCVPRRTLPPRAVIDESIGFRESLRLRRGVYFDGPR